MLLLGTAKQFTETKTKLKKKLKLFNCLLRKIMFLRLHLLFPILLLAGGSSEARGTTTSGTTEKSHGGSGKYKTGLF